MTLASNRRRYAANRVDPCRLARQVDESCKRAGVFNIFSGPLPAWLAGERVFGAARTIATKTASPAGRAGRGRAKPWGLVSSLKRLVHRPGKLAGVARYHGYQFADSAGSSQRPASAIRYVDKSRSFHHYNFKTAFMEACIGFGCRQFPELRNRCRVSRRSALYGCPKDGHYFVCEHGWYTEVSRAVWIYSCCHAISVWVVFGLVPLSLIYGALTEWSDSDSEQEGEK